MQLLHLMATCDFSKFKRQTLTQQTRVGLHTSDVEDLPLVKVKERHGAIGGRGVLLAGWELCVTGTIL